MCTEKDFTAFDMCKNISIGFFSLERNVDGVRVKFKKSASNVYQII